MSYHSLPLPDNDYRHCGRSLHSRVGLHAPAFRPARANNALMVVFGSLTLIFFLLAAGDFTGNHTITVVAGVEGIFTGLSAVYLGIAQVLNEAYGRTVLPVGPRA